MVQKLVVLAVGFLCVQGAWAADTGSDYTQGIQFRATQDVPVWDVPKTIVDGSDIDDGRQEFEAGELVARRFEAGELVALRMCTSKCSYRDKEIEMRDGTVYISEPKGVAKKTIFYELGVVGRSREDGVLELWTKDGKRLAFGSALERVKHLKKKVVMSIPEDNLEHLTEPTFISEQAVDKKTFDGKQVFEAGEPVARRMCTSKCFYRDKEIEMRDGTVYISAPEGEVEKTNFYEGVVVGRSREDGVLELRTYEGMVYVFGEALERIGKLKK